MLNPSRCINRNVIKGGVAEVTNAPVKYYVMMGGGHSALQCQGQMDLKVEVHKRKESCCNPNLIDGGVAQAIVSDILRNKTNKKQDEFVHRCGHPVLRGQGQMALKIEVHRRKERSSTQIPLLTRMSALLKPIF